MEELKLNRVDRLSMVSLVVDALMLSPEREVSPSSEVTSLHFDLAICFFAAHFFSYFSSLRIFEFAGVEADEWELDCSRFVLIFLEFKSMCSLNFI